MHKLLKLPWGMILTVTLLILVIVGPSLAPYDPIAVDLNNALQGPSAAHLVGTDQLGRDVFSRLLTGGQTTVGISLAALVLSMIVGVPAISANMWTGSSCEQATRSWRFLNTLSLLLLQGCLGLVM